MTHLILVVLAAAILGQVEQTSQRSNACTRAVNSENDRPQCRPCFRPESEPGKVVVNKWANVTDLELEKTELRLPTPQGSPPKYPDYSQEMALKIKTNATDPENDVLTYNYAVSAGRIVGTGAGVTWDLNKVWPGTYTITAGVDDGCGLCGAKVTKTVTILPAENAPACLCPEIRIDSLNERIEGLRVPTFSAYISGPLPPRIVYNWSVSVGAIESGQGTRTIQVRPPEDRANQNATVTVEITGIEPGCDCPRTATKTFKY